MSSVAKRMTIILMRTVIIERIHHSGNNLEIVTKQLIMPSKNYNFQTSMRKEITLIQGILRDVSSGSLLSDGLSGICSSGDSIMPGDSSPALGHSSDVSLRSDKDPFCLFD